MTTIWKYDLFEVDEQEITIPFGYELLSVQVQNGQVCLWAKVEPKNELDKVTIIIHGTGHPADDTHNAKFIGTFQLYGGSFVGHVFAISL
jgi:hypothetical protein